MKVLFLIDSLQAYGAEKSLTQISTRFKNFQPVFVHLYEGDQLKGILKENGISVYSLNLQEKYNFLKAVKKVAVIIRKEKPVIIHSTLFGADVVSRMLKKKFPEILLVGSLVNNSYSPRRYRNLNFISTLKLKGIQFWDKITSRRVDHFISNSETIKLDHIKILGIPPDKITTIYRGRGVDMLKKSSIPIQSNEKIKPIRFLNISRLEVRKGHLELLKAFYQFQLERPNSELIIAGEGPLQFEMEKQIEELKLKDKIKLLGYRDNIPQLLRSTDFFIFPTHYEGLPGSLIEALLLKVPVLISNIPENLECVDTENALIFEYANPLDLLEKMNIAVSDICDWKVKSERAYINACQKFDINKISKKYERFYLNLLQNNL